MPLHKGADGFMSDKDFKTFYWPTLKAVIVGLVNEGCVPFLFVEGGYNQRLDVIARDPDIPAGSTLWIFDKTDMNEVKKALRRLGLLRRQRARIDPDHRHARGCRSLREEAASTTSPATAASSCRPARSWITASPRTCTR